PSTPTATRARTFREIAAPTRGAASFGIAPAIRALGRHARQQRGGPARTALRLPPTGRSRHTIPLIDFTVRNGRPAQRLDRLLRSHGFVRGGSWHNRH